MTNFVYDALAIGNRLQQKRKEKGYSQEKAAEDLGISTDSLSNYENGKTNMTAEIMARVSKLYGVTFEWIIGNREEDDNGIDPEIIVMLEKYSNKQQRAVYKILEIINESFAMV